MVLTSHGIAFDDWCATSYLQGRHRKTLCDCHLIRAVAFSKLSLKQKTLKEKGAHGSPCYLFRALSHSKVSRLKIWSFAPNYEILLILACLGQSWKASRGLHAVKIISLRLNSSQLKKNSY